MPSPDWISNVAVSVDSQIAEMYVSELGLREKTTSDPASMHVDVVDDVPLGVVAAIELTPTATKHLFAPVLTSRMVLPVPGINTAADAVLVTLKLIVGDDNENGESIMLVTPLLSSR